MSDREHLIRERAFHLWERAGSPHHRSDEFWNQAETEIQKEHAQQKADSKSAPRKAAADKPAPRTVQSKRTEAASKTAPPQSPAPSSKAKPDKAVPVKPKTPKAASTVKPATKTASPRKEK